MRPTSLLPAMLAVTSLVGVACGPSIVMDPAGDEINPRRLVAMPSAGIEYGFDFGGQSKLDEGATRAAHDSIDTSINYRVSTDGGRFLPADAFTQLENYRTFRRWSELVLKDVTMAALGRLRDPPPSVFEWHFRSGVASWRAPLAADHVLITLFIDGHDSTGRAIAVAFAGGWTAGHRIATCAVRLADGHLVWCNVDLRMRENITKRAGAQEVVDGLLARMLATANTIPHAAVPEAAAPPRQAPAAVEPPQNPSGVDHHDVDQKPDEEAP
ncbi:MAG TPA: hypothetical protein VH560_06890 [Polyangia bacterium]|jgi:hypothetical protein|nr:hypothetical protein [Polyangia bacterium]